MALIACCFVYTLAGTFGYLSFGLEVNPDILKSYPANDPLVIVARALIAVVMITRCAQLKSANLKIFQVIRFSLSVGAPLFCRFLVWKLFTRN